MGTLIIFFCTLVRVHCLTTTWNFSTCRIRAIFVWPWNENERAKQKKRTNENRAIWLVYWMLGWKKLHAWELCRNQSILRCDVILQRYWPSQECHPHIRVFFGGKTKKPRFDLFIYWGIKQITNTYRIQFSRSYENRSTEDVNTQRHIFSVISLNVYALPKNSTPDEKTSWHSMTNWAS